MTLKLHLLAMAAALALPIGAQATTVSFDGNDLSQALSVTNDGLNVTLSASNGGVVNTYGVNAAGTAFISGGTGGSANSNGVGGPGWYVGAIEDGAGNFVSNSTAPESGSYTITFDQAVTSIDLRFEFLTADAPQPETVSDFAADGVPATNVVLSNASGTTLVGGLLTTSVNNGLGNLSYSGGPFTVFSFDHVQTASNIGFTITALEAELAPVPLPAALPMLLVAVGGLGLMRRRQKA